jgi:hypothetical protein
VVSQPVIARCSNGHTWHAQAWIERDLVEREAKPRNPWDLKRCQHRLVQKVATSQDNCPDCGLEWEHLAKPCNHKWRPSSRVSKATRLESLQSLLGL